MNVRCRRAVAVCVISLAGVGLSGRSAAWAADVKADAAGHEGKDGWITLFDGKTLNGWHKNPKRIGHGTGGRWVVEPGGVLAGEQDPPSSGNGGILLTDREFGDFELQMEIKPAWGMDSGIFLRSTDKGQCIQAMVDYYEGGNVGQFYGEAVGGWGARTFSFKGEVKDNKLVGLSTVDPLPAKAAKLVAACTGEEWLKAWKIGEWNKVALRVEGGKYPRVTTKINGLTVGVFDAAKFEAENFDKDELAKVLGEKGHIAVQVHGGKDRAPAGGKCRWRNIRVREL